MIVISKVQTEGHDFYCLNCGKKGIPIARKKSKQHEKFHRKKLFCPWCQLEINHIECRTPQEVEEFRINFENGVYENEREDSLCHVRDTSVW